MGILLLSLGLIAILVALVYRAAGMAMLGSFLAVLLAFIVTVWMRNTMVPQTLGLIFLMVAAAVWAASPPPDELSDPAGAPPREWGEERLAALRASPRASILKSVDPPNQGALGLLDHLWLAIMPLVGFVVCFLGLRPATAFVDGVWGSTLLGTPGVGLSMGFTDVSAAFGMLLVFPGSTVVLFVPLTGLAAVLVQVARGRSTAFSALVEWGVLSVLLNGVSLAAFGLR